MRSWRIKGIELVLLWIALPIDPRAVVCADPEFRVSATEVRGTISVDPAIASIVKLVNIRAAGEPGGALQFEQLVEDKPVHMLNGKLAWSGIIPDLPAGYYIELVPAGLIVHVVDKAGLENITIDSQSIAVEAIREERGAPITDFEISWCARVESAGRDQEFGVLCASRHADQGRVDLRLPRSNLFVECRMGGLRGSLWIGRDSRLWDSKNEPLRVLMRRMSELQIVVRNTSSLGAVVGTPYDAEVKVVRLDGGIEEMEYLAEFVGDWNWKLRVDAGGYYLARCTTRGPDGAQTSESRIVYAMPGTCECVIEYDSVAR